MSTSGHDAILLDTAAAQVRRVLARAAGTLQTGDQRACGHAADS